MKSVWVCLTLLLFGYTNATARAVSVHTKKEVETIRQLRAMRLPTTDELESRPPAQIPGLLRLLNHELRALIIEDL